MITQNDNQQQPTIPEHTPCISLEPILFLLTFIGGGVSLYAINYFMKS